MTVAREPRFRERPTIDWTGAACAGMDTRLWFPGKGDDLTEAKTVCADCPIRRECGDYAIDNGEHFGIWGGVAELERRMIRRRRYRLRIAS